MKYEVVVYLGNDKDTRMICSRYWLSENDMKGDVIKVQSMLDAVLSEASSTLAQCFCSPKFDQREE